MKDRTKAVFDLVLSLFEEPLPPTAEPKIIYIGPAALKRLEEHGGVAIVTTTKMEGAIQLIPFGTEEF